MTPNTVYVDKEQTLTRDLTVRNVPVVIRQRCKAKAAIEGRTLQQVIIDLMTEYQADFSQPKKGGK